jgi:uncharacterized protein (UPF0332 family)
VSGLWDKAVEAAEDARSLLAACRANGAASRAYYATFCAARAGLRHAHPDLNQAKTHAGVLRLFSLVIVVKAGLNPELGQILSATEGVRLKADFDETSAPLSEVTSAIADMETFLTASAVFIGKSDTLPPTSNPDTP